MKLDFKLDWGLALNVAKFKSTKENKMDNNNIKTLFEKYLEKQPQKYAIREVYFGHIGNMNCNDEVINELGYQEDIQKSNDLKAKLLPLLNEEQTKQLDNLIELIDINNIETEVSSYESGFKLGVNLGMESCKFINKN